MTTPIVDQLAENRRLAWAMPAGSPFLWRVQGEKPPGAATVPMGSALRVETREATADNLRPVQGALGSVRPSSFQSYQGTQLAIDLDTTARFNDPVYQQNVTQRWYEAESEQTINNEIAGKAAHNFEQRMFGSGTLNQNPEFMALYRTMVENSGLARNRGFLRDEGGQDEAGRALPGESPVMAMWSTARGAQEDNAVDPFQVNELDPVLLALQEADVQTRRGRSAKTVVEQRFRDQHPDLRPNQGPWRALPTTGTRDPAVVASAQRRILASVDEEQQPGSEPESQGASQVDEVGGGPEAKGPGAKGNGSAAQLAPTAMHGALAIVIFAALLAGITAATIVSTTKSAHKRKAGRSA
jgi:hypothetical protein